MYNLNTEPEPKLTHILYMINFKIIVYSVTTFSESKTRTTFLKANNDLFLLKNCIYIMNLR